MTCSLFYGYEVMRLCGHFAFTESVTSAKAKRPYNRITLKPRKNQDLI